MYLDQTNGFVSYELNDLLSILFTELYGLSMIDSPNGTFVLFGYLWIKDTDTVLFKIVSFLVDRKCCGSYKMKSSYFFIVAKSNMLR